MAGAWRSFCSDLQMKGLLISVLVDLLVAKLRNQLLSSTQLSRLQEVNLSVIPKNQYNWFRSIDMTVIGDELNATRLLSANKCPPAASIISNQQLIISPICPSSLSSVLARTQKMRGWLADALPRLSPLSTPVPCLTAAY